MLVLVAAVALVGGGGALQIPETWVPFTQSDPSWEEGCVAFLE